MLKHYIDLFWSRFHFRRGLRLLGRSMFQKAASHFEKSMLLDGLTESFFYFAICMIALNRHNHAIKYLEDILEKHDDNMLAATTLAECYMVVREWDKAERILGVLQSKYTENLTIKYLYVTVSDPAERERYAQAKEYFFLAKEALEKKQYDTAIDNITKAIDRNDTNASYYFFASIVMLEAKRDKKEVEQYLEKAVYLRPNNESYKRQLRYVKMRYKS